MFMYVAHLFLIFQPLSVGTFVLLRNSHQDGRKGGKLTKRWNGPYKIVESSGPEPGHRESINANCNQLECNERFKGSKACFQKKGIKLPIGAWCSVLLQSGWKESIFARAKLETGYNEYLGTRPDDGKLSCCSTR